MYQIGQRVLVTLEDGRPFEGVVHQDFSDPEHCRASGCSPALDISAGQGQGGIYTLDRISPVVVTP